MAVWNNLVRGHVTAIKANMGWDPTKIVDEFNPMPEEYDRASGKEGNKPGFGKGPLKFDEEPVQSPPEMDKPYIPVTPKAGGGKSDPFAGKGKF